MQQILTSYCAIFWPRVSLFPSGAFFCISRCLRAVVASCGDRATGFGDRVGCEVCLRARPGGSVSGRVGPRGLRNRVAAVGAAPGSCRRVCFAPSCSVPLRAQKFSSFFWHDPKKPSPVRKPRCCKGVSKTTSEARARARGNHVPCCVAATAAMESVRGAACTPKK